MSETPYKWPLIIGGPMIILAVVSAFAGYSSEHVSCKIILHENSIITNTTIIGADIEDRSNDSVVFEGNEIVFAGNYK